MFIYGLGAERPLLLIEHGPARLQRTGKDYGASVINIDGNAVSTEPNHSVFAPKIPRHGQPGHRQQPDEGFLMLPTQALENNQTFPGRWQPGGPWKL